MFASGFKDFVDYGFYFIFSFYGKRTTVTNLLHLESASIVCAAAAACRETWQMVTRACPQCGGAYKPESVKQTFSSIISSAFIIDLHDQTVAEVLTLAIFVD